MNLCAQYLRQAEALKADMTDSKMGAAEVWTSRQALQDVYQKMLVTDLEYALDKKVEQDLWNHAFKNQITTLQSQAKNRANPNRSEVQANLALFLEAASGFYTQLLQELCTVFNVDLPCRVRSSQLGIISNKQGVCSGIVTPQSSSCSYICQHCLVHLGDIARYRNQTSQAESYYRHAAQLVPSNGQPYNQLAILASSKGDHLTTIFYYCRSIAVKFPFPAASTNLQKALSKALESRDEVKNKWNVADFIKAFIKFHGHVYLNKSPDKLSPLREKLEEQFQRLVLQKAFSSQQLVHLTVINLFDLNHLRDLSLEGTEQTYSPDQLTSWAQLLGLFVSFLGVMCCRVLLNHHQHQGELLGECPLPAVKVSLDWLRLRPSVFQEGALHQRQHVWPWLVSILNSFQPCEEILAPSAGVTPLPEEFELQGFLALRPALRTLDFSKGHQGMLLDGDTPALQPRHHRLISLGRWIADTLPCLMRYQASDEGQLLFLSDLPGLPVPEPQEREVPVLQESSNGEAHDAAANRTLKSVLSAGRGPAPGPDAGERPVVTFKENIKPREPSRDAPPARAGHAERPRDPPLKAVGTAGRAERAERAEPKREGKRKCEAKRTLQDKACDAGKQVKGQPDQRKTPVSQPQTTCSSQFIPIHHPGAFPPLPSRPGFPPQAYVIPPPVPFAGLQVNPGFSFSAGVPGAFLQNSGPQPNSASSQGPGGKPSHIPYSQQRPSAPGPAPGPGGPGQQPAPQQLQVQTLPLQQQQQSPTKPVQMGKSPPHIPGMQQYMQVQEQPAPMWGQGQAGVPKMQMQPAKQSQQQPYFLSPQAPPGPLDNSNKGMKFPDVVQMQDYYWEQAAYRMGGGERGLGKRPPPGGFCPEADAPSAAGPRGAPFEENRGSVLLPELVKSLADLEETGEGLLCTKAPGFYQALAGPLSTATRHSLFLPSQTRMDGVSDMISQSSSLLPLSGFPIQENFQNNSIFSQAYGHQLAPHPKPDAPMMHQEPSLYSLFEGTPWSPSLPASSDQSTPASQSPHSSNPSSLPSSPPTHSHAATPFSNFGPIGTPDSRDRRLLDRWKTDKTGGVGGLGLDYLPSGPVAPDPSWHQPGPANSSWAGQDTPMEDSSTVLLDSLKSIWSSSMRQPGPSALEQLLLQQKQKQQRAHGNMNPPH
ncbi:nonsense-mediated mRNA decay factor SMG7 isoform X7 [Gadus macrocephalus]|uniref:nonsense-mediated mRNA decay factor SMG7 isoform X7 n=1 Tax=Gadus macrocephalus TaxID=80720 RepID=UPI0028CB5225|nr:nonsense-mediated mRNA decay factor SMG7 isoform X7 [Gadus macrocephalus]